MTRRLRPQSAPATRSGQAGRSAATTRQRPNSANRVGAGTGTGSSTIKKTSSTKSSISATSTGAAAAGGGSNIKHDVPAFGEGRVKGWEMGAERDQRNRPSTVKDMKIGLLTASILKRKAGDAQFAVAKVKQDVQTNSKMGNEFMILGNFPIF